MRPRQGPYGPAEGAQPLPPIQVGGSPIVRVRRPQLQVQEVDQPVQQRVLAPHVRVQRHRGEPDTLGDGAHGHGGQASLVDEGQCLVENQPSLVVHGDHGSGAGAPGAADAPE
jgi:hypothetical protein